MNYPIWKPILIVLVLLGCGSLIATKGLKPGIDLAGGTVLTYDVLVPTGRDATEVINNTIAIVRERIDPTGTKNLIWREESGNRLSVTMALPSPLVGERRDAFDAAKAALLADTLDRSKLERAVENTNALERAAEFEGLAGGDDALLAQLTSLADATGRQQSLFAIYTEAEEAFVAAEDAAGSEISEDEQTRLDGLLAALDTAANDVREARLSFDAQRRAVLSGTLGGGEIDRILELETVPARGKKESAQAVAWDELKARYPGQGASIDTLAAATKAYNEVKGPLDDPEDLKAALRGAGVLEFRIAATPQGSPNARPSDTSSYEARLAEKGPRSGLGLDWRWFEIDKFEEFVEGEAQRDAVAENPALFTQLMAARRGLVGKEYNGKYYVLVGNTPELAMTRDDEWKLTGATRQSDGLGRPAVGFSLDGLGAKLLGDLTGPNVGRNMAVLLDGKLKTAPNLLGRLSNGGQITGEFSQSELQYLIRTLGAGSLEGQLSADPIAQKTTGPALGADNLRKGLRACVMSLIAVSILMAIYYFFAGLVADFALLANMIIILGVMSMIEATFTLPGIAGLVLTIGMAVDANVLIFERIREEQNAGAKLSASIRQGFGKALSTILDANITTLITCFVLGYTATAEVKGFAVVLGIGIIATLFTALFSTRVIIEIYQRVAKPKQIAQLPTVWPALHRLLEPNVNWTALRNLFLPLSLVLIVAGLSMVVLRGQDLFDIEFRSGTEVTFNLAEGQSMPLAEARERLAAFADNPEAARLKEESEAKATQGAALRGDAPPPDVDFALLEDAQVTTVGDGSSNGQATGFSVATLIENSDAVSGAIKAVFRDVLNVTEPIAYAGMSDSANAAKGKLEPITSNSLAQSMGVGALPGSDPDVQAYLGGVGILLQELTPAATLDDVSERIKRMRQQPSYTELGSRPFEVFGLERAEIVDGQETWKSMAVVVRDTVTNYAEDRTGFEAGDGLAATEWALVRDALQRDTSLASVSNFSSQVSGTMKQQAIVAMVLSLLAVIAYIWMRFGSFRYGLAAIVALVHDVSITLGVLAICGWLTNVPGFEKLLLGDFKINLALVAALLTIVGYSLNDTIIVFDRIRENRGRLSRATPQIVNDSINQTISRTVLTSGTTLLAVGILYVFGGPGVHGFAFAMLVGVLVGTYSSVAIAAPILLIGDKSELRELPEETPPPPAPHESEPAAV